jgi:glycosyltransferase 2 family protein
MDDRWQRLTRALQLAAILCVAIVWTVYLSRSVDAAGVGATLSHARGVPLALAALLVTLTPLARTAYWKSVLAAASVPYRVLLRYTLATNAANAVLPARAGDAMRVWLLRDRHGVPVARSAAAVVLEKTADVTALGLLVAPLPWLLPSLPEGVGQALRTVLVVIGVLLAALGIASRHTTRSRWLAGLAVLREPSRLAPAFGAIVATWLLDLGCVLLVMAAVGLTPRLADALLVLLFVNLATAIPASPGQLGTHELGALTALRLQGVAAEQAVAFALLYHAAQLVPVLALGLVDARSLLRARAPT